MHKRQRPGDPENGKMLGKILGEMMFVIRNIDISMISYDKLSVSCILEGETNLKNSKI